VKTCSVCRIAFVDGEEMVEREGAYWAFPRLLHVSCPEAEPDLWPPEFVEARQETRQAAPRRNLKLADAPR